MKIKSASKSMFDQMSLGECMVRLSPPEHGRIEFANSLEVWVGGGEYNVAYGLLTAMSPQDAVELGTAHGALLQSTRGDTSQINLSELMHVFNGGSARIIR